ncbi:MAG TPA: LLM class flavin-dependent oxidoreductase [Vicinamibacterales bacterium]|nr:LLM class flavin-dependent oxidoreductase [Vicinamibacterales bacterium]
MAPEAIGHSARLAEELDFGELWFSEDCFFAGGMSGVTAALGATVDLPVGLGIVSALTRHPALLAMEIATMSRLHPGRLRPGVGLGVPVWLEQMGLMPESPLTALRECMTNLRALLAGEEVTFRGKVFSFHKIFLTHQPQEELPLYMGLVNRKGLVLSGEIADGTVLSVLAGTAYIRWAREQIAGGAAAAGRTGHHRIATYALYSVDADSKKAKEALRSVTAFYLEAMPKNALSQVYGIADEAGEMLSRGGAAAVAREMPAQWLEDLVIAGDPDECADKINAFLEAGSDSVNLWVFPLESAEDVLRLTAREVLPRI